MTPREHLERRAVALFIGFFAILAIFCGAIIVSGWFAGVLEDHAERIFWAGAMLSGLAVIVFAAAAFPGFRDDRREISRLTWTIRIGLLLAVLSPTLCLIGMIADFYRLL
jgi:hypothetical protein